MGEEYIRRIMVLGMVPLLGPVILYDDMEDLLKWTKYAGAGDAVFEKDTAIAYNGLASLHFKSRVTNPAEDDEVGAERKCFARPGKKYRLEFLWKIVSHAASKMMFVQPKLYDGTDLHTPDIRFDPINQKWTYKDSGGVQQDIVGGAQNLAANVWHRFQMEWDEAKEKYGVFMSDGIRVDMSAIDYLAATSGGALHLHLLIYANTTGAAAVEMHIDDLLLMEI